MKRAIFFGLMLLILSNVSFAVTSINFCADLTLGDVNWTLYDDIAGKASGSPYDACIYVDNTNGDRTLDCQGYSIQGPYNGSPIVLGENYTGTLYLKNCVLSSQTFDKDNIVVLNTSAGLDLENVEMARGRYLLKLDNGIAYLKSINSGPTYTHNVARKGAFYLNNTHNFVLNYTSSFIFGPVDDTIITITNSSNGYVGYIQLEDMPRNILAILDSNNISVEGVYPGAGATHSFISNYSIIVNNSNDITIKEYKGNAYENIIQGDNISITNYTVIPIIGAKEVQNNFKFAGIWYNATNLSYATFKQLTRAQMYFDDANYPAMDKAGYKFGTVYQAVYSPSAGHDGFSSYEFDGVNDYIFYDDSTSNAYDTGTNFSVSVWFYANDVSGIRTIWTYGMDPNNGKNNLLRINGGYLEFVVRSPEIIQGTTVLNPNTWYHVVVTVENGHNVTIYLNGQLEKTYITATNINMDTDSSVYLGIYRNPSNSNFAYPFDGFIDDFEIFGVALPQGLVQDLYLQGSVGMLWQNEYSQPLNTYYQEVLTYTVPNNIVDRKTYRTWYVNVVPKSDNNLYLIGSSNISIGKITTEDDWFKYSTRIENTNNTVISEINDTDNKSVALYIYSNVNNLSVEKGVVNGTDYPGYKAIETVATNNKDIVFNNLTIVGDSLFRGSNIKFNNINFTVVGPYEILLQDVNNTAFDNISVLNNNIRMTGTNANVSISNSNLSADTSSTLKLFSGTGSGYLNVTNTYVSSQANQEAIYADTFDEVNIVGNIFENNAYASLVLQTTSPVLLKDNIYRLTSPSIFARIIESVSIPSASQVSFINNTFEGIIGKDVYASGSGGVDFINNTITSLFGTDMMGTNSITLQSSSLINITGNNLTDISLFNDSHGIVRATSGQVYMADNKINNAGGTASALLNAILRADLTGGNIVEIINNTVTNPSNAVFLFMVLSSGDVYFKNNNITGYSVPLDGGIGLGYSELYGANQTGSNYVINIFSENNNFEADNPVGITFFYSGYPYAQLQSINDTIKDALAVFYEATYDDFFTNPVNIGITNMLAKQSYKDLLFNLTLNMTTADKLFSNFTVGFNASFSPTLPPDNYLTGAEAFIYFKDNGAVPTENDTVDLVQFQWDPDVLFNDTQVKAYVFENTNFLYENATSANPSTRTITLQNFTFNRNNNAFTVASGYYQQPSLTSCQIINTSGSYIIDSANFTITQDKCITIENSVDSILNVSLSCTDINTPISINTYDSLFYINKTNPSGNITVNIENCFFNETTGEINGNKEILLAEENSSANLTLSNIKFNIGRRILDSSYTPDTYIFPGVYYLSMDSINYSNSNANLIINKIFALVDYFKQSSQTEGYYTYVPNISVTNSNFSVNPITIYISQNISYSPYLQSSVFTTPVSSEDAPYYDTHYFNANNIKLNNIPLITALRTNSYGEVNISDVNISCSNSFNGVTFLVRTSTIDLINDVPITYGFGYHNVPLRVYMNGVYSSNCTKLIPVVGLVQSSSQITDFGINVNNYLYNINISNINVNSSELYSNTGMFIPQIQEGNNIHLSNITVGGTILGAGTYSGNSSQNNTLITNSIAEGSVVYYQNGGYFNYYTKSNNTMNNISIINVSSTKGVYLVDSPVSGVYIYNLSAYIWIRASEISDVMVEGSTIIEPSNYTLYTNGIFSTVSPYRLDNITVKNSNITLKGDIISGSDVSNIELSDITINNNPSRTISSNELKNAIVNNIVYNSITNNVELINSVNISNLNVSNISITNSPYEVILLKSTGNSTIVNISSPQLKSILEAQTSESSFKQISNWNYSGVPFDANIQFELCPGDSIEIVPGHPSSTIPLPSGKLFVDGKVLNFNTNPETCQEDIDYLKMYWTAEDEALGYDPANMDMYHTTDSGWLTPTNKNIDQTQRFIEATDIPIGNGYEGSLIGSQDYSTVALTNTVGGKFIDFAVNTWYIDLFNATTGIGTSTVRFKIPDEIIQNYTDYAIYTHEGYGPLPYCFEKTDLSCVDTYPGSASFSGYIKVNMSISGNLPTDKVVRLYFLKGGSGSSAQSSNHNAEAIVINSLYLENGKVVPYNKDIIDEMNLDGEGGATLKALFAYYNTTEATVCPIGTCENISLMLGTLKQGESMSKFLPSTVENYTLTITLIDVNPSGSATINVSLNGTTPATITVPRGEFFEYGLPEQSILIVPLSTDTTKKEASLLVDLKYVGTTTSFQLDYGQKEYSSSNDTVTIGTDYDYLQSHNFQYWGEVDGYIIYPFIVKAKSSNGDNNYVYYNIPVKNHYDFDRFRVINKNGTLSPSDIVETNKLTRMAVGYDTDLRIGHSLAVQSESQVRYYSRISKDIANYFFLPTYEAIQPTNETRKQYIWKQDQSPVDYPFQITYQTTFQEVACNGSNYYGTFNNKILNNCFISSDTFKQNISSNDIFVLKDSVLFLNSSDITATNIKALLIDSIVVDKAQTPSSSITYLYDKIGENLNTTSFILNSSTYSALNGTVIENNLNEYLPAYFWSITSETPAYWFNYITVNPDPNPNTQYIIDFSNETLLQSSTNDEGIQPLLSDTNADYLFMTKVRSDISDGFATELNSQYVNTYYNYKAMLTKMKFLDIQAVSLLPDGTPLSNQKRITVKNVQSIYTADITAYAIMYNWDHTKIGQSSTVTMSYTTVVGDNSFRLDFGTNIYDTYTKKLMDRLYDYKVYFPINTSTHQPIYRNRATEANLTAPKTYYLGSNLCKTKLPTNYERIWASYAQAGNTYDTAGTEGAGPVDLYFYLPRDYSINVYVFNNGQYQQTYGYLATQSDGTCFLIISDSDVIGDLISEDIIFSDVTYGCVEDANNTNTTNTVCAITLDNPNATSNFTITFAYLDNPSNVVCSINETNTNSSSLACSLNKSVYEARIFQNGVQVYYFLGNRQSSQWMTFGGIIFFIGLVFAILLYSGRFIPLSGIGWAIAFIALSTFGYLIYTGEVMALAFLILVIGVFIVFKQMRSKKWY